MQLLMRRPEIQGFICASLPANMYDFSFLAPCPSSGLIVHGEQDTVTPHRSGREAREQALAAARHHDRLPQIESLPTTFSPITSKSSSRCARLISTSASSPRASASPGPLSTARQPMDAADDPMSEPRSDFLRELDGARAYPPVHRSGGAGRARVARAGRQAYIGFDCTADSLHVGTLVRS